jgi:Asp-tRNA(Asn)/Glu-tRNA(Gln) amidotransferase A subunit family amidase
MQPAEYSVAARSLCDLPATRLTALLAAREISSRELVEAHLARIESRDGALRAFTRIFRERLRRRGHYRRRRRPHGSNRGR